MWVSAVINVVVPTGDVGAAVCNKGINKILIGISKWKIQRLRNIVPIAKIVMIKYLVIR